jgi:hypothetical protein
MINEGVIISSFNRIAKKSRHQQLDDGGRPWSMPPILLIHRRHAWGVANSPVNEITGR